MEWFLIAACILINAFLSSFEIAFVTITKPILQKEAAKHPARVKKILEMRRHLERTLSTIQIGITLVAIVSGTVGGVIAAEYLEPLLVLLGTSPAWAESVAMLIAVVVLTYVNVVIGELVPKAWAYGNPVATVIRGVQGVYLVQVLFTPFVKVLEYSTKVVLRLIGFDKRKLRLPRDEFPQPDLTKLNRQHRQYVLNLLNIQQNKLKDVMLPWQHVVTVETTDSVETVRTKLIASGHTRLPVLQGKDVIGVLHSKEFLAFLEVGKTEWLQIVRPLLKVREGIDLLSVLRVMQQNRCHQCVVVNESGEHLGIVTIEDIMEVIVGDLYDEDDDSIFKKVVALSARMKGKISLPG